SRTGWSRRQRHSSAKDPRSFARVSWVLDHADTVEKQDAAANALIFKTNVLWSQLDALYSAYVEPGRIPPGAWLPGTFEVKRKVAS
ncbi:MAG: hypothetical protein AAFW87_14580, partial [Pseudomonadota bacterium]